MDGYSAGFRIFIEMGLPFLLMFLYYYYKRIKIFKGLISNNSKKNMMLSSIPTIFNFTFSIALIIGILIKEANYSVSYIYLAVFLFTTTYPDKINE